MHGVGYLLFALTKNDRSRLRSAYFRMGLVQPRQPNAYSSSSSDAQLLRKFSTKWPTLEKVWVFTKNLASSPHRFESLPHFLNFQSKFWIQHFCVCLRSNKERHRHQNGCNRQQRWILLKTVTKFFTWWNFRFLCVDIHGVFPACLAVSKKGTKQIRQTQQYWWSYNYCTRFCLPFQPSRNCGMKERYG